jgi:hypothetical protein
MIQRKKENIQKIEFKNKTNIPTWHFSDKFF